MWCGKCEKRLCANDKGKNKWSRKLQNHECVKGRRTKYFCKAPSCRKYHEFGLTYQCPISCFMPVQVYPKIMILTSAIVSNAKKFECTVCLNSEGLLCEKHALLEINEYDASYANMILLFREKASIILTHYKFIQYLNFLFLKIFTL